MMRSIHGFIALSLAIHLAATTALAQEQPSDDESLLPGVEATLAESATSTELSEAAPAASNAAVNCCDPKKQAALKKAIASAYAPVLYNNKFDYLCDECYCGWHLGEDFKRLALGDCWTVDVGGQYRAQYNNANNFRGLGLSGRDDEFLLHRTRLYVNAEYSDFMRVYVEGIDAESNYEDFAPRAIDVDRSDILNGFADFKLHDRGAGELWFRAGRQELLYGAQRTVSPLDWGNTRRTFDGVKLLWKSENWDTDVFWTKPVFVDPHNFNHAVDSQDFMGAYATYKGTKDQTLDFYYLRFSEEGAAAEFDFNTFGSRWNWKSGNWLAECEGMYQFGEFGAVDHTAGAFVAGIGRDFPCATWKPTLWVFYDWASGDETIGNGYHHLFPLAHPYWGNMDIFGFRNLEDLNVRLVAKPSEKVKLQAWWHLLYLQDGDDVPYNTAMTPLVTTPGGDQELGQELDFILSWAVRDRFTMDFGYSRFFTGDFFATNPTPGLFSGDANFYYVQATVSF